MGIVVISSSVRTGRLSHRAALFLARKFSAELIDLKELNFPLFNERLNYMTNPAADVVAFANKIKTADGVVVVSPVYNASFPAALKNVIDLLVDEWVKKPVMVTSVTSGATAGISTVQALQALFMKLGARVAAPMYTIVNVEKSFSEDGEPTDLVSAEKWVKAPIDEFLWIIKNS